MIERLIAAAVGLAVLLPAVILGGVVAVDVVVPLAAAVCVAEFAAMAFPDDRWVKGGLVGAGWLLIHASALYGPEGALASALPLVALVALGAVTLRPGETLERAAEEGARAVLGVAWIGSLTSLCLLRREEHGLAWIFLVLGSSWLGDTGGYFAGRFFGRRPLYPRVSPKKTWEGALGGVTLATVGALVVRSVGLPELSVVEALVLGPSLCVAGILGDLSESLIKRACKVKDSGWIMPGHGGLLDRIDSVMFVAPVALAWVTWMEG